jgi:DNA-binding MarR family transcriptional regulator/N-acetylglutamate synthase-like GNAT family acetyltransferase
MDAHAIQQVRRFNRVITQRVGALEQSYLRRGRPLGEARLIYETGLHGADVRVLRDRLGLDSGYLSRLLRSLEAQRLILLERRAEDGRQRRVRLTAAGQAELAAYEGLSDTLAEAMLAPLEPGQRAEVLGAMATIARLLESARPPEPDGVEVRVEAPESDDARWCVAQYFDELAKRFEAGFDPAKSNPAAEAEMVPPVGCFVLARMDGRPVGCGALKCQGGGIGEVKRMWTAPAARGRGVARRVLQSLEEAARSYGLRTLRLETNRTLIEAQALYRREGYREVDPFNEEAYAHHWFEKQL